MYTLHLLPVDKYQEVLTVERGLFNSSLQFMANLKAVQRRYRITRYDPLKGQTLDVWS